MSNFCLIVYVSIFHYFVFMTTWIILLSLFTDNTVGIENFEMSAHPREYVLEWTLRFKCSFYLEKIKIMSSCFLDFINCKTKIFLYVTNKIFTKCSMWVSLLFSVISYSIKYPLVTHTLDFKTYYLVAIQKWKTLI